MIKIIITIHYRCNYTEITSNYSSSGKVEEERQLVLLFAAWRLLLFNILWGKTAWVAIKCETSMKRDKYTNFLGLWEKLVLAWWLTVRQSASLQVKFETEFHVTSLKFLFSCYWLYLSPDVLSTKLYTTSLFYRALFL